MMTATPVSSTTGADRPTRATSTMIVLFGHLAWLAYVWLVATFIYVVVVVCVAIWGTVDQGLWRSVVAGWQRWVIFAAGITITATFLRMLVRNGVTRRTVSAAAMVTMAVIAAVVAIWTMVGYSVERAVYDANGWTHSLNGGDVFAWGDLPRLGIETALVIAAYYAAGWIVGACFYRWRTAGGIIRLLPALLPVAAMELVVSPEFGGADVDVLASWRDRPPLVVTVVAGAAILAATLWVARRLTVETPLR